jgi:hypothetical protein
MARNDGSGLCERTACWGRKLQGESLRRIEAPNPLSFVLVFRCYVFQYACYGTWLAVLLVPNPELVA